MYIGWEVKIDVGRQRKSSVIGRLLGAVPCQRLIDLMRSVFASVYLFVTFANIRCL